MPEREGTIGHLSPFKGKGIFMDSAEKSLRFVVVLLLLILLPPPAEKAVRARVMSPTHVVRRACRFLPTAEPSSQWCWLSYYYSC